MNLDDFSYEENGRRYINPQVALDEENAFIQNLRDTQQQNNAQIAQQTHDLGTDVPSNIGGLNGAESYFNARYQTPQTNYTITNLKAAAQAKALTDALNSELAKAKKRYQDEYYAAKSRANNNGNNGNNGDTLDDQATPEHETTGNPADTNPSDVDTVSVHDEKKKAKQENVAINNTNNAIGVTGSSSKLPNVQNGGTLWYLVAPDGSKSWFVVKKSIYGNGIETPNGDYEQQSGIDYINSKLRQGYKVQWKNGKDLVPGTWRLVTGIDN